MNNKSATWKISINVDDKKQKSIFNYFMHNMLHYDYIGIFMTFSWLSESYHT